MNWNYINLGNRMKNWTAVLIVFKWFLSFQELRNPASLPCSHIIICFLNGTIFMFGFRMLPFLSQDGPTFATTYKWKYYNILNNINIINHKYSNVKKKFEGNKIRKVIIFGKNWKKNKNICKLTYNDFHNFLYFQQIFLMELSDIHRFHRYKTNANFSQLKFGRE